ncbi:MAG TPA: DUF503 domain-containing protein [Acidimicrobiia bacterium]|jgi:hypothetical protein
MHASAMRVELRVRDARSLKSKRMVVKSLTAHLRETFSVAVSEVDHNDLWQRCALGIAAVAPQSGQVERILQSVRRAIDSRQDVELLGWSTTHLEQPS